MSRPRECRCILSKRRFFLEVMTITQVRLIPLDAAAIASILDDIDQFQERTGVLSARANRTLIVEVARQTSEMLQVGGAQAPWCGYLAISDATSSFVGTCGFKGAPKTNGVIEIIYFTFPEGEHKGYATAMANALIDIARRAGRIRKIIAYTTPQHGAAVRVLEKIGMSFGGEVTHPEEGRRWNWELLL